MPEPQNFVCHGLTIARMHNIRDDGSYMPYGPCDVCALLAILKKASHERKPEDRGA